MQVVRALARGLSSVAARVQRRPAVVEVRFPDGHTSSFHYNWLRDNCACPLCRQPSSGQKHVGSFITDFGVGVVPRDVSLSACKGQLDVAWGTSDAAGAGEEEHVSRFPLEWLREHCYANETRAAVKEALRAPQPWDAQSLQTHAYSDLMSSDGTLLAALRSLHTDGVISVEGVPVVDGEVTRLASRLGGGMMRETFYGRHWNVLSLPEPSNVAYSEVQLPMHQDLCYFETPPGLQLLHAHAMTSQGGETEFADGLAALHTLRDLFPDEFETLQRFPITYEYKSEDQHRRFHRPVIARDDRNLSEFLMYYSPPFTGPLRIAPGHVIEFYKAYHKMMELVEGLPRYSRHIHEGECIVFNNRRVVHGRRAFNALEGRRHLQGCYVDLDDMYSQLRILEAREKQKQ